MTSVDRARGLLQQTEKELRKILAEAASEGDYGNLVQVATWARALSQIVSTASTQKSSGDRSPKSEPAIHSVQAPATAIKLSPTNKSYPRFLRNGDRIVRVAWSKRDRAEYEHKAPYEVLLSLVASISDKGANGRVFATDEVLPICDEHGVEVPSYQVYTALGLLKHVGLVEQHGRRGYSIPRLNDFADAVKAVWRDLPEK